MIFFINTISPLLVRCIFIKTLGYMKFLKISEAKNLIREFLGFCIKI